MEHLEAVGEEYQNQQDAEHPGNTPPKAFLDHSFAEILLDDCHKGQPSDPANQDKHPVDDDLQRPGMSWILDQQIGDQ